MSDEEMAEYERARKDNEEAAREQAELLAERDEVLALLRKVRPIVEEHAALRAAVAAHLDFPIGCEERNLVDGAVADTGALLGRIDAVLGKEGEGC